MANDADWVADVKRWYFSTQQAAPAAPVEDDAGQIGYEAAHPHCSRVTGPKLSAAASPT